MRLFGCLRRVLERMCEIVVVFIHGRRLRPPAPPHSPVHTLAVLGALVEYFHSSYVDLVLSGLIGIRPKKNGTECMVGSAVLPQTMRRFCSGPYAVPRPGRFCRFSTTVFFKRGKIMFHPCTIILRTYESMLKHPPTGPQGGGGGGHEPVALLVRPFVHSGSLSG